MEDLEQSKSDREKRESPTPLHKEPIGCISSPRVISVFLPPSVKQRAVGLSKI